MTEYTLEDLLKPDRIQKLDIDISVQAASLVGDGFPLHSSWKIRLEQVIK